MRLLETARITTILIILVALSSCVFSTNTKKDNTDTNPEIIYNGALTGNNSVSGKLTTQYPGADWSDLPYVPVIVPPDVLRIWIYDHVTPSNDLVVGHWVFIKLRPERWYIEDLYNEPSRPQQRGLIPQIREENPAVPSPATGK